MYFFKDKHKDKSCTSAHTHIHTHYVGKAQWGAYSLRGGRGFLSSWVISNQHHFSPAKGGIQRQTHIHTYIYIQTRCNIHIHTSTHKDTHKHIHMHASTQKHTKRTPCYPVHLTLMSLVMCCQRAETTVYSGDFRQKTVLLHWCAFNWRNSLQIVLLSGLLTRELLFPRVGLSGLYARQAIYTWSEWPVNS